MSVAATSAGAVHWGNAHRHFLAHLLRMPAWQRAVVVLAALFGAIGAVGTVTTRVGAAVAGQGDARAASPAARPASGSSGFVADAPASPSSSSPIVSSTNSDGGLVGRVSPHMMRVGVSIVVGLVLGWLLRAFLKTMTLIALVLGGGLWLLQRFGIVHLSPADYDAVRTKSVEATHWLRGEASMVKAIVLTHLPSSGGGAFGAFLGFRRR